MSQSKDGFGSNPGTQTRLPGQRPAHAAGAGMAEQPLPTTDTNEMQDLLRKIAEQIADAEQRQGAALDGVRTRLTGLAEQTEVAKAQAPAAIQTSLGSIEDRISQMARTVEIVGRDIQAAAVPALPPPPFTAIAASPAAAPPLAGMAGPAAIQTSLGSIEDRISQMARTVEIIGRDIQAAAVPALPPPPFTAIAASPAAAPPLAGMAGPAALETPSPVPASMHVRGFGRGQVRGHGEMPALDPARALEAARPLIAPTPIAPIAIAPTAIAPTAIAPTAIPMPAPPVMAALPSPAAAAKFAAQQALARSQARPRSAAFEGVESGGPWDQAAADALAGIFSDEDAAAPVHDQPAAAVPPAPPSPVVLVAAAPAPVAPPVTVQKSVPTPGPLRPEPPALASGSGARPAVAAPALAALAVAPPPPAPAPIASAIAAAAIVALSGTDRDWLNTRFADIAGQLERSLRDVRPDRALDAMGRRFDTLEASLATVMTAVRSDRGAGAGQAAMQSLEGQVTGLKVLLDAAVARLESLDALKADVTAIANRLSALDRLEKAKSHIAESVIGARGDIDRIALAFEQHRSVVADLGARAPAAADDPRLDGIHSMIEHHEAERREGEAATVAVLQAIQGAIDQLTHRIDYFEHSLATATAAPEPHDPPGAYDTEPARAVPAFGARMQRPGGHDPDFDEPADPRQAAAQTRHGMAHHGQPVQAHPSDSADVPRLEPHPIPEPAPATVGRVAKRGAPSAPPAQAEASIPRTRRGLGNILRPKPEAGDDPAPDLEDGARPVRATGGRDDLMTTARRAAGAHAQNPQASGLAGSEPDPEADSIASRLPGQKRPKAKPQRGGFFTFEKAGSRPTQVVVLVALLAAGAGMLYGTLADRPANPMPMGRTLDGPQSDKQRPAPGKLGALPAPADAAGEHTRADADIRRTPAEPADNLAADIKAADLREATLSTLPVAQEPESQPLVTGSPLKPGTGETTSFSTGILIDSGAPMPTARDLQRYTEEQRMARISSHLADKAVQKTERDHADAAAGRSPGSTSPAVPASHTPDAARPQVAPEAGPAVAAVGSAAMSTTAGLPPAQIGPMSLRVAAAKGDPSAEFEVASRFALGKGVPKDFVKAAEWYQRAASRGSAPAQYRLGGLYERGIGVPADPARARGWYKRAAEQGNVKAMHNLAVLYTQRDGAEPDYATASQWFIQAAGRGLSDSQFNLGILNENGMGMPKSQAEAYKWYALAAERGDREAAKRRDALAARMSVTEVEQGRNAVARWRPQPTDAGANDPFMAGQAWRTRNGDEASATAGANVRSPAPASGPSPARQSSPRQQEETEIIDLSSAAIDQQLKRDAADSPVKGAGSSAVTDEQAIVNRKRRLGKAPQSPGEVEKMLTQLGYNPAALKKARPGGESDAGQPAAAE